MMKQNRRFTRNFVYHYQQSAQEVVNKMESIYQDSCELQQQQQKLVGSHQVSQYKVERIDLISEQIIKSPVFVLNSM